MQQGRQYQVRLVSRHLMGALTRYLDSDTARVSHLQMRFVKPVDSQTSTIEPRPQVGGCSWYADGESHLPSIRM